MRSVTEVTRYIRALIDTDPELADLWVEGEVSNFRRASSGHCYFTLKDSGAELHCVMWRDRAELLSWLPEQGDWVDAHGYISVYERGGVYQFYVDMLRRGGIGGLWQEFLELKERLAAEGLFDEERKRPLPKWPRRIGVVTSPVGAAFQDILNVLRARYPLVEVVLSPSLVQGADAPASLVRAIERLNEEPGIDVVIVARGGGSMEDLWAFNNEQVARAIAASKAPVVSGVGHETDFTIADFVADLRAPTPSAAAAAVVPDIREVRAQVRAMVEALKELVSAQIEAYRSKLAQAQRLLELYAPHRLIAEWRQRVDELMRRAQVAVLHRLEIQRAHLRGSLAKLEALNPRLVLDRGYAVVQARISGKRIRSVQQVSLEEELFVHVSDGRINTQVTGVMELGRL
ncbi:MAG: exodeoxyribonuclease VII large subunit [Anaerolineae bacterium]|nr:exodeoxyribonuclease VII large subunit [Anaerolineae bacterium]